ncbi:MAG: F420-0--gamma-glutamyl ligase [Clostridiales bacterium]
MTETTCDYAIVNEGKKAEIEVDGKVYRRICLRTHVLWKDDDLAAEAQRYAGPLIEAGDILFFGEKAVAATQGRSIPVETIHPSRLARFLVKFVYKNPHGVGISIPQTMEMAIRECGRLRILLAAGVSVIGKLLGKRGWFYKVAGYRVASIDGPADYVVAPLNGCVTLGPLEPDKKAKRIADAVGIPVIITDINDLGGVILGVSDKNIDKNLMVRILKDNPLCQAGQQTPMGLIRLMNN